jgi:DNA polymerase-1
VKCLQGETDPEHPAAWDTETDGLDPFTAQLVGLGCAWGPGPEEVAYLPLGHREGEQLPLSEVLTALRPMLESSHHPKVLQNAKFDRLILQHQGIQLQGVVFDTMLASYVLHPEQSHNLTDLCRRYLPDAIALSYKDLGLAKGQTMADLEIATAALYCGLDAHSTYRLQEKLSQELAAYPLLQDLFTQVELPLEPILAAMEDRGIRIDVAYLQQLSQQLAEELQGIEQQAYEAAEEVFNLGSPKQLADILFEKLGLNRKKSRKTKTGYSTDHATLEKLQGDHPIIDSILEHRTLAKLKSTYVDALPSLVNPRTQRIHTDFNQAVTNTGRLSSSNPNLQNIPIRSAFSRQIRQAFIPEPGWMLVSADYSQIELRILAHLSQEPVLLQAYQTGQDVHRVTAQLLLEKEEITPAERNLGKTINFGVIYGMGAQRFAREAGVSAEEGRQFIDRYRQTYAQVFRYLELMKKTAITTGFVQTIQGRRRYFDFATESLKQYRGAAPDSIDLEALKLNYTDAQLLRSAANAPIQGSSADIIKIAMVHLAPLLQPYQARLLLQVHDELILEMPEAEQVILQPLIQTTMEQAVTLSVPLQVEVHSGPNWMVAK